MSAKLPTLSTLGVVSDPTQKLDLLLSYLFVSDASQSYVFEGNVVTVSKLWQQHGSRPDVFSENLKSVVNRYLGPYFLQCQTEVTYTVADNGDATVALVVRIQDGTQDTTANWRFKANDSKIVEVANLLNKGIEP